MVVLLASALVGTALVAAGATKLGRSSATADAVGRLVPGLGPVARRVLAQVLPPAEIVVGAALIGGPWRVEAGAVAAMMLGAFTVTMLVALRQGREVRCGCFGEASQRPVSWRTIARNVVLLGCATFVWAAAGSVNGDPSALAFSGMEVAALLAAAAAWSVFTLTAVGGRTYWLMRRLSGAPGAGS